MASEVSSLSDPTNMGQALFLQNLEGQTETQYTAKDDRRLIDALFPNEGPIGLYDFRMRQRQAGAALEIEIEPGAAKVGNGYFVQMDTVKSLTMSAPSSGSRLDLVVIQIYDPQLDGTVNASGGPRWSLKIVQGVASGSPSLPAIPDRALALGYYTITSASTSITTANITNYVQRASCLSPVEIGANSYPGSDDTVLNTAFVGSFSDMGMRTPTVRVINGHRYRIEGIANIGVSTLTNPVTIWIRLVKGTDTANYIDEYLPFISNAYGNKVPFVFEYECDTTEVVNFGIYGQATVANWWQTKRRNTDNAPYIRIIDLGLTNMSTA